MLGGNKSPTPTATLTKAAKAANGAHQGTRKPTITHISHSKHGFEPGPDDTTERRLTRATDRKGECTPQRVQAAKS